MHRYWRFSTNIEDLYTNTENLHKYWKFYKDIENIEFWYKMKNTHLPQVEKFYLKSFKPFYAQKWDFWTI